MSNTMIFTPFIHKKVKQLFNYRRNKNSLMTNSCYTMEKKHPSNQIIKFILVMEKIQIILCYTGMDLLSKAINIKT